jgi:nucleoside-diphosphate-sugar epimerase
MLVFVTGASGAIGTRLVPQLIARGHEVVGTYRSAGSSERVAALGAEPILVDLLDPGAVRKAVLESEPEAIVHEATALADVKFSRNLDRSFVETNRLRTEGTDNLIAAARARQACPASSLRAAPATGATRARAGRSRPRTTHSIPTR